MQSLANKITRKLLGGYAVSDDFKEIDVIKKRKVRKGVTKQLLPYVVANSATKGYKFRNGTRGKNIIVKILTEYYDPELTEDENRKIFIGLMDELTTERFTGVTKK
jgi:hypothetical protein